MQSRVRDRPPLNEHGRYGLRDELVWTSVVSLFGASGLALQLTAGRRLCNAEFNNLVIRTPSSTLPMNLEHKKTHPSPGPLPWKEGDSWPSLQSGTMNRWWAANRREAEAESSSTMSERFGEFFRDSAQLGFDHNCVCIRRGMLTIRGQSINIVYPLKQTRFANATDLMSHFFE